MKKATEALAAVILAGGSKFPNPDGKVKKRDRMVKQKCDNNTGMR